MSRESTRDVLLDCGLQVFLERGYNHSGIEAVLRAAGVPKGSFYYYFASKEDFGIQVLNRCAAAVEADLDTYLGKSELSPLERLRQLGEAFCERLESRACRNGCLVGNLSQEMAAQSEVFRVRLAEIFQRWAERYAVCLEEAQKRGELPVGIDSRQLAEFWICGWQGAVLRSKTARDAAPLRNFLNTMYELVLRVR